MLETTVHLPTALHDYERLALTLDTVEPTADQFAVLAKNIRIVRDTIVFITGLASAKGLGGHTGGPYDVTPEMLMLEALVAGGAAVDPVAYDEAGHRVAIQYVLAALHGDLPVEALLHYREADWRLPGHPEKGYTPGVGFSSGRLGHLWPFVNGIARQDPDRAVCLFGSDGSQQEGNSAEAARLAVQHGLNVKLLVDDNDITIAGHPSQYLGSFDLGATLRGHGMPVSAVDGEDIPALWRAVRKAIATPGPQAVLIKRKIAPGIPNIEGKPAAHDVVKVPDAVLYFRDRGNPEAVEALEAAAKLPGAESYFFPAHAEKTDKNREAFGKLVARKLGERPRETLAREVVVVDSDLEGSCGLHHIRKAFPEVYISAGIMERSNFSLAAGFGSRPGAQGIFGTFAAFAEMVISELTMARLNGSRVLCHFSHSGVDDIADNTCHFGINNLFLDGGIGEHDQTQLYFPADEQQLAAILDAIFDADGVRVVMTTRSAVPTILDEGGQPAFGGGYVFHPGRDAVVRSGTAGWVISYGDMLHRCLDAVDQLRRDGHDVGLINKAHLNAIDEETLALVGRSPFVALFETQNRKTGLGVRYGAQLLERDFHPVYRHYGVTREGCGGLGHQIVHQGLDSRAIHATLSGLLAGG